MLWRGELLCGLPEQTLLASFGLPLAVLFRKLTVPVDVLELPGRPNPEQWRFIADHPSQGEVLAQPVASWLGAWAPGIWEHHEKFDGTGYPKKLAGREISLAGRIVALADAFETMTPTRSYKKSMTIEAARAEVVAV